MRGFVSGVFWGLVASAVVFVVAALRLGDPGAVVVEDDDPDAVVVTEPATGAAEGDVVVTTDPEPEAGDGSGLGVSTGPQGTAGPFDEPDGDAPVAVDVGASDDEPALVEETAEPVVVEPEPAETPEVVVVEEPASEPAADAAKDEIEVQEDGTTVIERTVPVEPVEEDG